MKKELRLVRAKEKEFQEIAKIYKEAFSEPPFEEPWTEELCLKQLQRFALYCDIYSLFKDKKIIGFIIMNPNYWFPGKYVFGEEAAIIKSERGKGYGRWMVEQTLKIYREKGFIKYMGLNNIDAESYQFWKKIGAKESTQDKLTEIKLNNGN